MSDDCCTFRIVRPESDLWTQEDIAVVAAAAGILKVEQVDDRTVVAHSNTCEIAANKTISIDLARRVRGAHVSWESKRA